MILFSRNMNYQDDSFTTHQPRTVYDSGNGTMNHFWDANGNLAQIIDCKHDAARLHEWDEENRLRFVLGEKYAGYYGYDANGERVYKLTGSSSMDDVNSGSIKAQAIFDDAVLYPNPYIVVTPKGYTKHYYAGTERLATAIGGGGFLHMQTPIVPLTSQHDMDIVKSFYEYYQDEDPFNYQQIISKSKPTEDILGNEKPDLEYQCKPTELVLVDVYTSQDILLGSISSSEPVFSEEADVYFYHGDHLGSANWITDADGKPIQYIHYAPYGELIANKQTIGYDERFKFTGKERDWETGYDYFGARFYDYRKGFWNSVDPLADKYPNVTPYLYCNGNPIMLVDPTGEWIAVVSNDDTGTSYTVVGGSVDVEDCNVYVVGKDYDPNSGIKPQGATILGQTATPYSFCNEKGNIVPGAVINMEDKSGDAFLAQFQNNDISLFGYVMPTWASNESGHNGGGCDFKYGADVNRGMPLSILGGKIGTARDVGNFAAGYLAARKGLSYRATMWAFDKYQNRNGSSTGEPPVSRWAQMLGFGYGQDARRANNFNQPNIYNAYR